MRIESKQIIFPLGAIFPVLPDVNVTTTKSSTTPTVSNINFMKCANTTPISISNFLGGAQGQMLRLLGDGNTTIVNGTTIKTNTAANKLLSSTKVYTFTYWSGVWYENE